MSKALTNVQECLSVCLSCYNAKMILQRLAISNDMDFWDSFSFFPPVGGSGTHTHTPAC